MRKSLMLLVVVLSISFMPASAQYSANAGRAGMGNAASPECDCNESSPPCYYDNDPWQLCNGEGNRPAIEQTSKEASDSSQDTTASAGFLLLVAYLLIKRML